MSCTGRLSVREVMMPLEPGFRWSTRVRPWLLGLVVMAAWLCLVLSAATVAEEVTDRSLPRIPITEIDAVPGAPLSEHPPTLRRLPLKPAAPPPTLPAEASTRHNLAFAGRTLAFTAKAGAVVFEDQGAPVAEIGYFAYLLDGTEPTGRPVTFAINGGPGAASAWLHIGALGPWRLPITQEAAHPTAPSELLVNGDTWLDFTDLVFIDPAGTGYSRLHNQKDQQVRERFWSVQGDIARDCRFHEAVAGGQRPHAVSQGVPWRKLRRLPRTTHRADAAVHAGHGAQRHHSRVAGIVVVR